MAFHFHTADEIRDKLLSYNVPLKPEFFGRRDEFQQDNLTEVGRDLLMWLLNNQVTNFYKENRWENPIEQIAVLGFGADYDLFRVVWDDHLRSQLDIFYDPLRCNAQLPEITECDGFDGAVLNAIGVYHIYTPKQCSELSRLGAQQPFVALFAELYARRHEYSERLKWRLGILVSDSDDRDLLCRYDALHQQLLSAYRHAHVTKKHLLMTNRWPG
jgi:hypothetical protein